MPTQTSWAPVSQLQDWEDNVPAPQEPCGVEWETPGRALSAVAAVAPVSPVQGLLGVGPEGCPEGGGPGKRPESQLSLLPPLRG